MVKARSCDEVLRNPLCHVVGRKDWSLSVLFIQFCFMVLVLVLESIFIVPVSLFHNALFVDRMFKMYVSIIIPFRS